jgi:hypothetical protein
VGPGALRKGIWPCERFAGDALVTMIFCSLRLFTGLSPYLTLILMSTILILSGSCQWDSPRILSKKNIAQGRVGYTRYITRALVLSAPLRFILLNKLRWSETAGIGLAGNYKTKSVGTRDLAAVENRNRSSSPNAAQVLRRSSPLYRPNDIEFQISARSGNSLSALALPRAPEDTSPMVALVSSNELEACHGEFQLITSN